MRILLWGLIVTVTVVIGLTVVVIKRGRTQRGFCWSCALGESHPGVARRPGLRFVASAEESFKVNDSDGNGKKDYWRKDVAGLFGWVGPDGRRIELLDLAGALADDRPATSYGLPGKPAPVGGYWYRAIRHADEKTLDPHRFVICAYPDNYPCPARFTYVVDESNVIFRKDLGQGGGIEVFPEHPLEDGWIKSN